MGQDDVGLEVRHFPREDLHSFQGHSERVVAESEHAALRANDLGSGKGFLFPDPAHLEMFGCCRYKRSLSFVSPRESHTTFTFEPARTCSISVPPALMQKSAEWALATMILGFLASGLFSLAWLIISNGDAAKPSAVVATKSRRFIFLAPHPCLLLLTMLLPAGSLEGPEISSNRVSSFGPGVKGYRKQHVNIRLKNKLKAIKK